MHIILINIKKKNITINWIFNNLIWQISSRFLFFFFFWGTRYRNWIWSTNKLITGKCITANKYFCKRTFDKSKSLTMVYKSTSNQHLNLNKKMRERGGERQRPGWREAWLSDASAKDRTSWLGSRVADKQLSSHCWSWSPATALVSISKPKLRFEYLSLFYFVLFPAQSKRIIRPIEKGTLFELDSGLYRRSKKRAVSGQLL